MSEEKEPNFKIPPAWIDRIFLRMDQIYGSQFTNQFVTDKDFQIERFRWQSALYGVNAEEIKRVINMCQAGYIKLPPNCIEFYHYCKGYKQPIPPKKDPYEKTVTKEIAQKYLKLIKDKLYGRSGIEGEAALSALDQQVLANKNKQDDQPPHWQDN